MKVISIQQLKRQLSAVLAEAAAGERFVVTRHEKPLAEIGAATGLHVGEWTDKGAPPLKPAIPHPPRRSAVEVLLEDRASEDTPR